MAMFRQAVPAAGGLDDAGVRGHPPRPPVDFNRVFGLAHFDVASDEVVGDRIAIGIHRDVPLEIHQPLVKKIDRGYPDRQRFQMRPFSGEQLARAGLEIITEPGIDLIAPFARLPVGLFPVAEGAARQEVGFDIAEAPLDTRGAVSIALLMRLEAESAAIGEDGHLRHGDYVPARSFQHHDVSVVDQTGGTGTLEVLEGIGEKDLAIEACEAGKELKEEHTGIAANQGSRLDRPQAAADLSAVRRSVVLHLDTGAESVFADGLRGSWPMP
jgi:hypothetical protein